MRINCTTWLLAVLLLGCFTKPDRVELTDGPRGDGSSVDATGNLCVDGPCITAGGTCQSGVCVIVQVDDAQVDCPRDMPCHVDCSATDACKAGVDCKDATTCVVECRGDSACQDDGVKCGMAAVCTVTCVGANACQHGGPAGSVDCRDSDCTVTCDGANACEDGIGVGPAGTCEAHCCGGACSGGVDTCSLDASC
jgi:hypothetical protein